MFCLRSWGGKKSRLPGTSRARPYVRMFCACVRMRCPCVRMFCVCVRGLCLCISMFFLCISMHCLQTDAAVCASVDFRIKVIGEKENGNYTEKPDIRIIRLNSRKLIYYRVVRPDGKIKEGKVKEEKSKEKGTEKLPKSIFSEGTNRLEVWSAAEDGGKLAASLRIINITVKMKNIPKKKTAETQSCGNVQRHEKVQSRGAVRSCEKDTSPPEIFHLREIDGKELSAFVWNYGSGELVKDTSSVWVRVLLDGRVYCPGTVIRQKGFHRVKIVAVDACQNESTAEAEFVIR